MNSSVVWLATILGLGVLSLVISCGEICGSMWMRHRSQAAMRRAAEQLAAQAQQQSIPVIGFLSSRSAEDSSPLVAAFHRGLAESGYIERQNLRVEYRWAQGRYDRLPAMAVELARTSPNVLVSVGGQPAAVVAKAATLTIPIVANFSADPVASGLVTSLNRPDGNVTGITSSSATLELKRLGFFHELVPQAATVGVLVNANNPQTASQSREMREAASAIGIQLHMLRASTDHEIDAAFDLVAQHRIPALLVASDSFFNMRRGKLVALAARHAVPAMYSFREYAKAGGLISYGIDLFDVYRQVGVYAGRILKGTKLPDLPVVEPSRFELAINLKAARALGLDVPPILLARADEVIE
jgi:putative ABC transport system substrate-binding protein